jgi:hypothetical protein
MSSDNHTTESDDRLVIELVADALILADVLTPNHDGTPEYYIVEAGNVEYLVKTVLDFAYSARRQMGLPTGGEQ